MGRGSIRQRGRDSWQLRVYLGTDPETGRQRWASRTVRGSQRSARAQLRELAEEAGYAHMRVGKTHRTHRADLDRATLEVLRRHRARAEGRAAAAGAALRDAAFVFSSEADGSRPWHPNWVTKRFIARRRAAGLAQFRLHDLRHFMATQMLAAGIPIVTVAQRLNHARASTTLNVYAHAIPGGDRLGAETLATILEAGAAQLGTSGNQGGPGW